MPSYLQYKAQIAILDEKDDNIEWITVKGVHIPIRKGQTKEEAIKYFFQNKQHTQGAVNKNTQKEPTVSESIKRRIDDLDSKTDLSKLENTREGKSFEAWVKQNLVDEYLDDFEDADTDYFYEEYGTSKEEVLEYYDNAQEWAEQQAESKMESYESDEWLKLRIEFEEGTKNSKGRAETIQERLDIITDWAEENGLTTSRATSRVSESEYIELYREDEDGDIIGEPVKIRLSDHDNITTSTHDIDLRFNDTMRENMNEILSSKKIKELFSGIYKK